MLPTQKKMFKVLTAVDKKQGGIFWMRVGTAFMNKDNASINVYLDAMPKKMELTLFELDENDRKRDEDGSSLELSNGARGGFRSTPAQPGDQVPF
ncbi:MAG: hypothetical protein KF773_30040 [Deltaproteobacteria bacterium]|nr:hypothetical protein [Deltaproteobacteria bacterium]MCW5801128.1 hypothetical protein [Deltaproteobacteria bacterium]